MKYRQLLNEDMDFILPGYREQVANRAPGQMLYTQAVSRDPLEHGSLDPVHMDPCSPGCEGEDCVIPETSSYRLLGPELPL